jgi:hypothetical protein
MGVTSSAMFSQKPLAFRRQASLHHHEIDILATGDLTLLRVCPPDESELLHLLEARDHVLKLYHLVRGATKRLEDADAFIDLFEQIEKR